MSLNELWSSSMTVSYGAFDESVPECANYSVFIVQTVHSTATGETSGIFSNIVFKDTMTTMYTGSLTTDNVQAKRLITITDDGFICTRGIKKGNTYDDTLCKPVAIYGIKDLEII